MHLRRSHVGWVATGLWTLFGVLSGMQIWISMLSHGHSLARIIVYQVLAWDVWVVFGFFVARLVRRAPLVPARPGPLAVHLLVAGTFAVLHAAWWVALELAIVPYDAMNPTDFRDRFLAIVIRQMPMELALYGLVAAAVYASDTYEKYRERELKSAQLERSLAEARLHALELQIQPHFLFNTLNAISSLVRVGQQAPAVAMISGLSDLLRYALEHSGEQRAALDDEAAMLRRYLEIQRQRFADRLTFEIDVAAEARRAAVPVLLLQPLAENAIHHGIAVRDKPGRIDVRAFRDGDTLRLEMFNTGSLPAQVEPGIGLSNTRARLQQLFGDRHRFDLVEREGGVLARVTLPWSEA